MEVDPLFMHLPRQQKNAVPALFHFCPTSPSFTQMQPEFTPKPASSQVAGKYDCSEAEITGSGREMPAQNPFFL